MLLVCASAIMAGHIKETEKGKYEFCQNRYEFRQNLKMTETYAIILRKRNFKFVDEIQDDLLRCTGM